MEINNYRGLLIVFDGPNGGGKTTLIDKLYDKLIKNGYDAEKTKEPTRSELGKFVREKSEIIKGNALACLISADRYEHLKNEIIPALEDGKIVLCDRYILSSYILQGMDKVEFDFINNLNSEIIAPDIQIALYASVDEIQNRLKERDLLTRFERNNQTALEIKYLNKGIKYLEKQNINIYKFNTEEDIKENVDRIYNIIVSSIK